MEGYIRYDEDVPWLCNLTLRSVEQGQISRLVCTQPLVHRPVDELTKLAFQLKSGNGKPLIPHFEVFDDSSVSIKEAMSQVESSFVYNGFASDSVNASLYVPKTPPIRH